MAHVTHEFPTAAIYPLPPLVDDALGMYTQRPNASVEEVAYELGGRYELGPEKMLAIARGALYAWRDDPFGLEVERLNRALFYVSAEVEPDTDILEEVTKISMPGLPNREGYTSAQMFGVNVKYTAAAAKQTRETAIESTRAIFALAQYISDVSAH